MYLGNLCWLLEVTYVCLYMEVHTYILHTAYIEELLLREKGVCGRVFIFAFNGTILQRIYVCWRPFLIVLVYFIQPRRRRGLPPAQISGEFCGNLDIEFTTDLFY